jgi:hypothetical protein
MKYFISDKPIRLREFGRNVQSMIEHATTIPDRAMRTRAAEQIVRMIIQLHPHLRDSPDVKKFVWDSVFVISEFNLDVDSPYPVPPPVLFQEKKEKARYNQKMPIYAHYGRNVELALLCAADMPEGIQRWETLLRIADFMRQCLIELEKDAYLEETVSDHMLELSGGRVSIHPDDLMELRKNDAPRMEMERENRNFNNKKNKKGGGQHFPHKNNNPNMGALGGNRIGGNASSGSFKKRK